MTEAARTNVVRAKATPFNSAGYTGSPFASIGTSATLIISPYYCSSPGGSGGNDGDGDSDELGELLGEGDADGEGEADVLTDALGLIEGLKLGLKDSETEGLNDSERLGDADK